MPIKVCLIIFSFFLFGSSQGQKITVNQQLTMLKIDDSFSPKPYSDSLTITPSKTEFNHKFFLNDTIENPINTYEITTIYIEEKVIMITSSKNTFLFQIKKKFIENNGEGIIEYYHCEKGKKLYLITIVKNGIYIRKDKSYYSSFFYSE